MAFPGLNACHRAVNLQFFLETDKSTTWLTFLRISVVLIASRQDQDLECVSRLRLIA